MPCGRLGAAPVFSAPGFAVCQRCCAEVAESVVYAKDAGFALVVYCKAVVPIAVAAGFGARGMRLNVVFAPVDFADHAADVLRIAAASDIAVVAAEPDVGVDDQGVCGGEAEQECGECGGGFHGDAFRLAGILRFWLRRFAAQAALGWFQGSLKRLFCTGGMRHGGSGARRFQAAFARA